ncbi:hypothetical protein I4U23_006814 [Adineta vaga]|nr:hypothetical protein I4U23_006814 [Adineta vaga]
MDLSIRKPPPPQQQQQQSPASSSRPILNPAAPINIVQSSSPQLPNSSLVHKPQLTAPIPSVVQSRHIHQSKYGQLLNIIEEMGKDIKPTYAGNKNSAERLRRAIASARILVRECQLECDRNNRI